MAGMHTGATHYSRNRFNRDIDESTLHDDAPGKLIEGREDAIPCAHIPSIRKQRLEVLDVEGDARNYPVSHYSLLLISPTFTFGSQGLNVT